MQTSVDPDPLASSEASGSGSSLFSIEGMVNVLKFQAVVACHKSLDKQADQDQTAT